MSKKIILIIIALIVLAGIGYLIYQSISELREITPKIGEAEARAIAEKLCIKGGEALTAGIYNENSKTWWFDANLNATQEGCNPACVVSEDTRTAEVNWRCTGLITPGNQGQAGGVINSFERCVAAGNPVMESYPRQCRANGQTFVEQIKREILCSLESRQAEVCTMDINPVCALVQIQCIKAPCNPIRQTFTNPCEACRNSLVNSYYFGNCDESNKTVAEMLEQSFAVKYPKYAKTILVTINKETENFIRGSVSFAPDAAGGIFLAAKIDGEWQIIFDGNGQISCSLSKYGFPSEMLADCAK